VARVAYYVFFTYLDIVCRKYDCKCKLWIYSSALREKTPLMRWMCYYFESLAIVWSCLCRCPDHRAQLV